MCLRFRIIPHRIKLHKINKHKLLTIALRLYFVVTYSLTPWSRVLLEKLTVSQLVKKFLALYGTRRFITTITCARHLSLS